MQRKNKYKQNENSENSDQVDHISWHLELYNHHSSPNLIISQAYILLVPSVLWRRWLGGRKGIRPVKNWVVSAGVVFCLERGADLHMAQRMPLPLTVTCFSKIQIGLTFLVPAHPGSPGKGPLNGGVCVCLHLITKLAKSYSLSHSWTHWWRVTTMTETVLCVVMCVCPCVGRHCESCKNGWTNRGIGHAIQIF